MKTQTKEAEAQKIVEWLQAKGVSVFLRAGLLVIEPQQPPEIFARILVHEPALWLYLKARCPRADEHKFAVLRSVDHEQAKDKAACIACGVQYRDHGMPSFGKWQYVTDSDEVEIVDARPLSRSELAQLGIV